MEFDRSLTLEGGQTAYIKRASNRDKSRTAEADNLYFHHNQVSKQHAELVNKDGRLYIKDVGSSFGTIVNDEFIRDLTEVKDQDVIGLSMSKSLDSIYRVLANTAVPALQPIRLAHFNNPKIMLSFRVSVGNNINSGDSSPLLISFHLIEKNMPKNIVSTGDLSAADINATDVNVTDTNAADINAAESFDEDASFQEDEDDVMSVDGDASDDAIIIHDNDSESESEDEINSTRARLSKLVTGPLYDEDDEDDEEVDEQDSDMEDEDVEVSVYTGEPGFDEDLEDEEDYPYQQEEASDSEDESMSDNDEDITDDFIYTLQQGRPTPLTPAQFEAAFQAQKDEALTVYLGHSNVSDSESEAFDDDNTDPERDIEDDLAMDFDANKPYVVTPQLNEFYNRLYYEEDDSDEDYEYNSDNDDVVYYVYDEADDDDTPKPSKVKTVLKEAAKGVGYAAATVLVLGAYGSTLQK